MIKYFILIFNVTFYTVNAVIHFLKLQKKINKIIKNLIYFLNVFLEYFLLNKYKKASLISNKKTSL